jgi:hypothetical protein
VLFSVESEAGSEVVGLVEKTSVTSADESGQLEGSFDALDFEGLVRDSSVDDKSAAEVSCGVKLMEPALSGASVERETSSNDDEVVREGKMLDWSELIESVELPVVTDPAAKVLEAVNEASVIGITASELLVGEASTSAGL